MAKIVDLAAARRARIQEALKGIDHVYWLEMPPWFDGRDPAFDSDDERLAKVIPTTPPSAPSER